MLIELDEKGHITLPEVIITSMGLSEGDQLEISEKDRIIFIKPVAVYPKEYLSELLQEAKEIKVKIALDEQLVFDNDDHFFDRLDAEP